MKSTLPAQRLILVADTNVYLSDLGILEKYLEDVFPFFQVLCIPMVVINEIDGLKEGSYAARNALRYISHIQSSKHFTVYVGDLDGVSNDDKIIGVVSNVENGVLITRDNAMEIKARGRQIRVIGADAKTYSDVKDALLKLIGVEAMDICEADDMMRNHLIDRARDIIWPVVLRMLSNVLGESSSLIISGEVSTGGIVELANVIDLVLKNFNVFTCFIPRASRKIIEDARIELISGRNTEKLREKLGSLLTLFGLIDDEFS